jgi:hypothetical protein
VDIRRGCRFHGNELVLPVYGDQKEKISLLNLLNLEVYVWKQKHSTENSY